MEMIMNDKQLGNMYIDACDVEQARLVLARAVGQAEPVLYEGEETPSVGDYDKDAYLNEYMDIQEDMAALMSRIERGTGMIKDMKERKYEAQCGNWLPRDEYIKLCVDIKDYEAHREDLWDQWWDLKYQADEVQKECTSVYPRYLQVEKGEEDEHYDPILHKKSAINVDTRMLLSDEAYYQAHMEEQEELFSYSY